MSYTGIDQERRSAPSGVKPIRAMRINGERLLPARDRFAIDHAYVLAHPQAFEPIKGCSEHTRTQFRAMVERAKRGGGTTRTKDRTPPPAPDGGLDLSPRLRPLRLP
jgi:hypothetical protein